jgi:hypothetical protein
LSALERSDCLIRLSGVAHFHKRKTTGATCVPIRHQVYPIQGAITFKQGTDARCCAPKARLPTKMFFKIIVLRSLIEQLGEAGFHGPGFCGTIKS